MMNSNLFLESIEIIQLLKGLSPTKRRRNIASQIKCHELLINQYMFLISWVSDEKLLTRKFKYF